MESVFSLNMIFILVLPRIDGNGDTQQRLKGMLVVFLVRVTTYRASMNILPCVSHTKLKA